MASVAETSTITNNLRFSSQYFDAESGLHYNTLRYYDPGSGRWLSRDPIGNEVMLKQVIRSKTRVRKRQRQLRIELMEPLYVFVRNSPANRIDPLGLKSVPGPGSTKEKCCIARATGGHGLGTVYMIWDIATRGARDSEDDLVNMVPGHARQDLVNAFRHCAGACMLSASFGPTVAWDIEECHERPGATDTDTIADRRNNAVGNRLGNTSPPPAPSQCAERCLEAMEDGLLTIDR